MPVESTESAAEARTAPRLRVPAMYTLVRARQVGETKYPWTGYIYDVSESGMRFELDEPIEPGTQLEVRAMLPGAMHTTFTATGTVVRIHDTEEDHMGGPVRMAMNFDQYTTETDRRRVTNYLEHAGLRLAA